MKRFHGTCAFFNEYAIHRGRCRRSLYPVMYWSWYRILEDTPWSWTEGTPNGSWSDTSMSVILELSARNLPIVYICKDHFIQNYNVTKLGVGCIRYLSERKKIVYMYITFFIPHLFWKKWAHLTTIWIINSSDELGCLHFSRVPVLLISLCPG